MNVLDSRHAKALNRVLNFAHSANRQPLQLDQLADVACLSKFHFIRVFQKHVGESPGCFVSRTRLERAASLLKHCTDLPISDIAAQAGFTSAASFSRKFADYSGSCPRAFRLGKPRCQTQKNGAPKNKPKVWRDKTICAGTDNAHLPLSLRVTTLRRTRVAYVRTIGRYGGCDGIREAMARIWRFGEHNNLLPQSAGMIGISWDFSSMTPTALRRYDACIPVPDQFPDDLSVSFQSVPGGKYAVGRFAYRRPEELVGIWRIFAAVLTLSPLLKSWYADIDVGPWYEFYIDEQQGDDYLIDLYAPLRPASKRRRVYQSYAG